MDQTDERKGYFMKSRAVVVVMVICVVAALATFNYSGAAPAASGSGLKIGVVSIRTVFNKTRQQLEYRTKAIARRGQSQKEQEALATEVAAEEAELRTHKPGTTDYLQQLQVVLSKRSKLSSQQEFAKQQQMLEDKLWMEKLFRETLKIANTMAKEKGLDLVLERTEPQFPISSEELMATFSTHKVLYAGAEMDMTDEVIARLDAVEGLQP